jgi:type II secretory pathway component PulJ
MDRPPVDRGESLVEVLIALIITSMAILLLMGALGTISRSSGVYRQQTDVGKVLAIAGETLANPSTPFHNCTTGTEYTAALSGADVDAGGVTVTVTEVKYWNGTTFQTSCRDDLALGYRQQLVTLTAQTGTASAKETLQVIKRG